MIEISIIVAVVVGLTEAIKILGLPSRFSPIVSIALAISLSFLTNTTGLATQIVLFDGLLIGLMASGLYSGAKATIFNK